MSFPSPRNAGLAALLLLGGCAPGPQGTLPQEVTLTNESACGFGVRAGPDGHRRALLMIDTGCSETWLSASTAERWGLSHGRTCLPTPVTGIGRAWLTRRADLDALDLGGARIAGLRPWVQSPASVDREGSIGEDVLALWPVLFDAHRKEIRLLPEGNVAERLGELYPGTAWTRLPLRWWRGVPVVDVPLASGDDLSTIVDTGAPFSMLCGATAKRLGLRKADAGTAAEAFAGVRLQDKNRQVLSFTLSLEGVGGADGRPVEAYLLPGLRIGGTVRDLCVIRHNETGLGDVLGMDVLSTFPWVLDVPERQLWVGTAP